VASAARDTHARCDANGALYKWFQAVLAGLGLGIIGLAHFGETNWYCSAIEIEERGM